MHRTKPRLGASVEKTPSCVPTIVFHGDRDQTVHPCNGEQVLEQWCARSPQPAGEALATSEKDLHVDTQHGQVPGGHTYTRRIHRNASGRGLMEYWLVHGAGHAWAGGSPGGSYTDPKGPDASAEMLRFFLEQAPSDPPS